MRIRTKEQKAKACEVVKRHYWRNKPKIQAYKKVWNARNRERLLEYKHAWYRKNKHRVLQKCREYRKAHPEVARVSKHNRRARKLAAQGMLNKRVVQQVYEDNIKKFGRLTCYLCFQPVDLRDASIDHRVPLSRGGSNLYENLSVVHHVCNCRKHARTEAEYHLRFTEVFCD